jgi:predicted enzyme involved in methoxymalonyl-ACP biosynthesis
VLVASYRDKYGPLGKIAALAGRREGSRFHIETWVMSCRAFSRRIEHHMLKEVFDRHDVAEVIVDFAPTERNQPSAAFLRSVAASADDRARVVRSSFLARCPALYHTRTEAAAVADAAR